MVRGASAADSSAKNNFCTFLPKIFTVKFCVFLPNFFVPMLHKIISENFFVSRFFCAWFAIALLFAKNNCICARAMLFRRPAAGGFYKNQGCFRFVSKPGYRALWRIGEVALRVSWQLPGWCCRFWIEGLNIGNVPHVFLRMYAVCPVHYAEDRRLGCVCVFGRLSCAHGRCVIVWCAKAFACLVNPGF